jgi:signal transduction histidine kinase
VTVRNAVDKQRLLRQNRQYYQDLERTLAELRRSQAALVQSEKMAALGRLVAGIAHEINNPLGALQSNTDTLARAARKIEEWSAALEQEQVSEVKRWLELLSSSARLASSACGRIASTVANLKKFAGLDEAEFRRANVREGLETVLDLLKGEVSDGIEVVLEFGDVPEIDCSLRQLNQLFLNLLLNAIEAVRPAGRPGVICVKTWREGASVKIAIEDNGCGIAPENLTRIFDPGFTTKRGRVAMGLGLPISFQIAQAHRGTLDVQSTPGEGSRFTVTLPLTGAAP